MHTVRLLGVDRTIRPGGEDPTVTPIGAYDCEYNGEAREFGKDSLRMAGIVQMLHPV